MRLQKPITMLGAWIVSMLALGLVANAAPPTHTGSPDPRDKMNIWVGRWKEVVERKETPYGHAATIPFRVTCSWSADRGFMVCEYISENTDADEGKVSDHLTIFTYDDKSETYKHLGISKDHKTLEEPNVIIEGNRWHYTYQIPDGKGGHFHMRDSYEFVTPEKRITRIEISSDGGQHWTLLSESVGVKVH